MGEHLRQRLHRVGVVLTGALGVALLVVMAVVPLTGPSGGTAVAALMIFGAVVGLLALSVRDGCAVLTWLVVLLLLVPQPYVLVGPLKSVGNPAGLVALGALAIWAASRFLNLIDAEERHPVRWTVLLFMLAAMLSYAAGLMRDLTTAEVTSMDRVVFQHLMLLGVVLLSLDGLGTRDRISTLLERVVLVGAVAAFVGVLEFVFDGFDFRETMLLPGLTMNDDAVSDTRSGFDRIASGASHPIEFTVVTAALVPLALHFALHAGDRRWRHVLAILALGAAIPMSVSRSGVLTLLVGLGVYAVAMTNRARFNALVLGLIGVAAFHALVPGLLGTVRSLFADVGTDPSIAGRTDDYAAVPGLLEGHWWLGRGTGTFIPDVYFFLDNQYLASLIQGGALGLAAFLVLIVVGIGTARGVRHRSADPALRSEGQAIAASIAAFAASGAVFDSMSFRQSAFLMFLLIGCAGAHWSLVRDAVKVGRGASAPEPVEGGTTRSVAG